MTACVACATVQRSIVSIVLRRAGEYGGDFKTEPNKAKCGAGQPTYDFSDVGQKRLGVRRLVQRTKYGYPSASARLAMQAESSLWGRRRVVGSKLKHDGTLGYISRGAARRSGLNPAGWHRYVPVAVVVAIVVIALAALGYAAGGASLGTMFKSPELAHVGTELVEGARDQTGVAPQRGMVAAAATIADAQKDEDEQGDGAKTTHTNETTTTPSAR